MNNPSKPKPTTHLNSPTFPRLLRHSLVAAFLGLSIAQASSSTPVLLYCPAYAEDVRTVFLKTGSSGYQSATLSISNVIELPAPPIVDGKITFFGPAGDDGHRTIAAIAEIGTNQNPLIIFYPAEPKAETTYETLTVDADLQAFPLASFHLLNLSPYSVRFHQDETQVAEMQNGESQNFKPSTAAGTPFSIRVKYEIEDAWALLSSSSWVARNDRRTLVCILQDPHSQRMNIRSVPLREIPRR